MTAVDVEVESIEHLDFEQGCEMRVQQMIRVLGVWVCGPVSRPCGRPAVGIIRCRSCKVFGLTCEPHRAEALAPRQMVCTSCGAEGPGPEIYAFEPLRVSS